MKISINLFCLILLVFAMACQRSPSADRTGSPVQHAQPAEPSAPSPSDRSDDYLLEGAAEDVATPFAEVAKWGVGGVPAWPASIEELNQLVQEARYARLYPNPNPGGYLRRAPWYFGDGCYAKAAHVSALAEKQGYPRPGKVLAFGGWATMRYQSVYLPDGMIWWTYHVVAAYHINSFVYVVDPLVSPERALLVDEWVRAIAPRPEKITLSFCDPNLYYRNDRCLGGQKNGAYLGDINQLLKNEYQSLNEAGYDPDTVL